MQIMEDRQRLHRIPEPGLQLPKTMAYLRSSLENLSCRIFAPVESALCAWFDFGSVHTIAFRADADALPVTEKTGLSFASEHPGYMHACGHDGHMAMLLELARRLEQKKHLDCNVLLVFQAGEETPGGAKPLCETGIFAQYQVEAIFALHLWPGLTPGTVSSRKNEMLSRSSEVNVTITGRSAHIAKAADALDALRAGTEFYTRAMEMEQSLDPESFRLLNFGRMESGTARNVISGQTHLEGSLRAFRDEIFESLRDGLQAIGTEVEKKHGCRVELHFSDGYPAVINPPELYDRVRRTVEFEELEAPSMISEDFSWYQRYLPGLFFFLGVGDTAPLHADTFVFDSGILLKGVDFLEKLAENLYG